MNKNGVYTILIIIGWVFITLVFGFGLAQMGVPRGVSNISSIILFWVGIFIIGKNLG
tara:strand:+ start:201 stop:371 length:171 start_codon:yes stop_codon:yes gene_type:complete